MGVVASDIVSAYGANYINEGQNLKRLLNTMAQKPETPSFAQSRIIPDTVYRLGNASITRVVQPFQKAFTALGTLNFTSKPIPLYNIKADVEVDPDDIVASWVGFLADTDNDRSKWPLIRYMMEVHFAPKIGEDLELNEYFAGEFTAPTAGTPGAAGTAMDGIKLLLDNGITGATMNQILLSATPSASNMFDTVEEFVDGIAEKFRNMPMRIYMSKQALVNYFRDKRTNLGGNTNYDDNKAITVDAYPNVELVGLPSMAGSNYIWATPNINLFHIRRSTGFKKPDVQKVDRQVKILTDWWEGIGFGIDELVWVYDGTNAS